MTPISDAEGEVSYVVGILVKINSRYATIEQNDGTITKVGKTKIEPMEHKKPSAKKKTVKKGDVEESNRIASDYEYTKCKAASGRVSYDNADDLAVKLRGKTLEDAYKMVAELIGVDIKELITKYQHLNPGQQRMCIGNRARGFIRNN